MPLPEPSARRHLHTRSVTYRGFLRDDGLWDIEATMSDVKTYETPGTERGTIAVGEPIHDMSIRLTIDESMTIRGIATSMDDTPFGECQQGREPMQQMLGVSLGPGWRQAIETRLGGERGCTHLRELLFNMATAAYQAVFPWREHERRAVGVGTLQAQQPPYHVGRCIAWNYDGAVVARHYPQFAGQRPRPRKPGTGP